MVNAKVIEQRLDAELPFMVTENVLMAAVKAGGDRQELHERIRRHSIEAGHQVKQLGKPNDLLKRLKADDAFSKVKLGEVADAKLYVGRQCAKISG